ncbi:MAG: hypothetical protein ACRDFS_02005 [Chloroflexota bacterium]
MSSGYPAQFQAFLFTAQSELFWHGIAVDQGYRLLGTRLNSHDDEGEELAGGGAELRKLCELVPRGLLAVQCPPNLLRLHLRLHEGGYKLSARVADFPSLLPPSLLDDLETARPLADNYTVSEHQIRRARFAYEATRFADRVLTGENGRIRQAELFSLGAQWNDAGMGFWTRNSPSGQADFGRYHEPIMGTLPPGGARVA